MIAASTTRGAGEPRRPAGVYQRTMYHQLASLAPKGGASSCGAPAHRASTPRVHTGGLRIDPRPTTAGPSAPRWRVFAAAGLALAATPLTAAPVDPELPTLGDASSAAISPAAERELARLALMEIRAGAPAVRDPLLKYYVRVHLDRLAEKAGLAEPVMATVLIDSPSINAFAVPGGVIGINLGLFLHAWDESEYSAVVAHELAHLSQRHYARRLEAHQALGPWRLAGLLAAIAIGAAGGADAGMAVAHGGEAIIERKLLSFSRAHEQEADRVGLKTLAAAGMDPDGMARMFGRMRQAYRFDTKPPEFLLTHPLTESRIADAKNQAGRLAASRRAPSLDYQMMRARAQIHYAASSRRALAEANARRGGGDSDKYAVAMALARAGRQPAAADVIGVLRARHPDSLLLAASHAEILTAAGHLDEALALLERELAINPANEPLAYLHAQALTAAGRPAQAVATLRRQTHIDPNDPDVWHLLAETAGLAGDTVAVHRARAEYFALVGAHDKAIAHLDYARRLLSEDDHQARAGIDQRILDMRTEYEALGGGSNGGKSARRRRG